MLVSIHGADGTGKSTVCRELQKMIPDTFLHATPSNDTATGRFCRMVLRDRGTLQNDIGPLGMAALFTSDMRELTLQHISVTQEWCAKNKREDMDPATSRLDIWDRWSFCTYAYQSAALMRKTGMSMSNALRLIGNMMYGVRTPDRSVILSVDEWEALRRMQLRSSVTGERSTLTDEDFILQRLVRSVYDSMNADFLQGCGFSNPSVQLLRIDTTRVAPVEVARQIAKFLGHRV